MTIPESESSRPRGRVNMIEVTLQGFEQIFNTYFMVHSLRYPSRRARLRVTGAASANRNLSYRYGRGISL
jgi:hypothetical protein